MKTKKTIITVSLCCMIAILSSCCFTGSCKNKDVVQESYIHKYGIAIAKSDWERRGKDGKIISLMKDGVTITKSYTAGMLNGETTFSFPYQDSVERKQYFDFDTLTKEVEYYSSGIPKKELVYLADNKQKVALWYNDGSPQRVEYYDNEKLISGQYFTILNDVESSVENGNGTCTRRNPLGELISRDTYEASALIMRHMYYHNGEPKSITPYKNEYVHGQKRTFHLSGEPHTIENWVAGYQDGITTLFQNGTRYSEIAYENGKKNGMEKRYNINDALVEEISWKDGRKHGPTKHYVANEVRTDWFFQGKPIASKFMFQEYRARS